MNEFTPILKDKKTKNKPGTSHSTVPLSSASGGKEIRAH